MKPPVFLKWAGSKRVLAPKIVEHFESRVPRPWAWWEPFLGSGAAFFEAAQKGNVKCAVLSDSCGGLINTFSCVRTCLDDLLEELDTFPVDEDWKASFTKIRDDYNWNGPHVGVEMAARFLWLNRAGFNGLYRENRDGLYNVPAGKYERLSLPSEEILRRASALLQVATIHKSEAETSIRRLVKNARDIGVKNCCLYLDPPYHPTSETASFASYTGKFGKSEQEALASLADVAWDCEGVEVLASNSDSPFTRSEYGQYGFEAKEVSVKRSISCKKDGRTPAGELLFSKPDGRADRPRSMLIAGLTLIAAAVSDDAREAWKKPRWLVACEYSGTVRDALRAVGCDAWSCDLLPTDVPGPHVQGDVLSLLGDGWDGMIAFPPCTYLCVSGLHWNTRREGRQAQTDAALDFVRALMGAPIPRICIENPIGCISTQIRKPDQIIQPWQFGHPESKATCLWLKNLPRLEAANVLELPPRGRWENQTDSGQNRLGPSPDRWKIRSTTYAGIATAMARQWGKLPVGTTAPTT